MRRCVRVVVALLAACWLAVPAAAQNVEGWFDGIHDPTCSIWGWARDASNSAPLQVRVYRDGDATSGTLIATLLADRLRADLQFPDQHHGFERSFTPADMAAAGLADGEPHVIHIYAVSHGGAVVSLAGNRKLLQCVSRSDVRVDLSTPVPVNSASGFLLSVPFSTSEAVRVPPLQPTFWRFTDAFVNGTHYPFPAVATLLRSAFPSITLNLLMPIATWGFGSNPRVWDNWPGYEQFVRSTAQAYKNAGLDAIVEIWNEPDYPDFWSGTREQFFETYLRTYTILRAELGPGAIIAGPSFGFYDRTAIVNFLEYCLANGCEVNSLTWHALDDFSVAALPARVEDARISFLQNPRYAPLRMQRIDINEIVGPVYTYEPAGTLQHYDAFEKSGAAGAAHACWPDSNGTSGCFNSTIDGLLTPQSAQPRAVWWLHKAYADGVAGRVTATVHDHQPWGGAVVVASTASAGGQTPQLLVGYTDVAKTWSKTPGKMQVNLEIDGWEALPTFAGAAQVRLLIERIPSSGEAVLPAPIFVRQADVPLVAGRIQLTLPVLDVGEVFRITAAGGAFTDEPLVSRATTIRAVHVNELRARIDLQRARFGLPPYAWSELRATEGVTVIQARQWTDLRTALSDAYIAAGTAPPSWTEPLTPGTTPVKAMHVSEIRTAVAALEIR